MVGGAFRPRDGRPVIRGVDPSDLKGDPTLVRDIPTSVDPGHWEEIKIA